MSFHHVHEEHCVFWSTNLHRAYSGMENDSLCPQRKGMGRSATIWHLGMTESSARRQWVWCQCLLSLREVADSLYLACYRLLKSAIWLWLHHTQHRSWRCFHLLPGFWKIQRIMAPSNIEGKTPELVPSENEPASDSVEHRRTRKQGISFFKLLILIEVTPMEQQENLINFLIPLSRRLWNDGLRWTSE